MSRSHGVRNEVDVVPLACEDGMGCGTTQLFFAPLPIKNVRKYGTFAPGEQMFLFP